MSREVRRVPVGWQHPTGPNEHAEFQARIRRNFYHPPSRLLPFGTQYVPLNSDYPESLAYWQNELDEMRTRTGHGWTFSVEYHLTGFKGHNDPEPVVHPFYLDGDESENPVEVRDEDHLQRLELANIEAREPDALNYMPMFDVPTEDLGWCLYETVSEGCPTTPVFATADELIDHLCTVGEDYDQKPYRREAAERLVCDGSSMGSMVVIGGKVLNSARDADVIAEATS